MYAKNTGKKVIPVLLKGAKLNSGWFLFKFGRIDCIDSTDSIQVNKLMDNLSNWIGKKLIENPIDTKIVYSKWNWGAFSFGPIWAIAYRIYWPLFMFIPYLILKNYGEITSLSIWLITNTILAIKGDEWAYKRQTLEYKDFENCQKRWNVFAYVFLILIAFVLSILFIGELQMKTGNSFGLFNRIETLSIRLRRLLF